MGTQPMPRIVQRTTRRQKTHHMKQAKNLDKHVRARRADLRDAEVGRRVRSRRLECRLSQTELADRIGLTFQQVQKYEKGVNRIGSGRLEHIAQILKCPVSFFFDETKGAEADGMEFLEVPGAVRAARAFGQIKHHATRTV